jgi:hypothetical protein
MTDSLRCPLQSSTSRYMINRLSFRTMSIPWTQLLEISEITFITTTLLLLHHLSSVPSTILSSSAATSGWLDLLVFDAKGGEIWRSDVWSLGGVHFFACIWNSCIALACLISVIDELWLACNNLWDFMVWCGWELEVVDIYVMIYICDFKLLIFWLVLVLVEFWG